MSSRGGKPPEITTVSERAMKSMPSVVMNDGMAKRIVSQPLRKPIAAQAAKPASIAGQNPQPMVISTARLMGISAKTEPTDRSNSPQIIRSVTPTATIAASGRKPSRPRMLA